MPAIDHHRSVELKAPTPGVVAVSLASNRQFPRHSHGEFGIGVLTSGAQRSWSGRGKVESHPGAVITVNEDEVHDGLPIDGCVRRWRMLYIAPATLAPIARDEGLTGFAFEFPSSDNRRWRLLFERGYAAAHDTDTALGFEQALVALLLGLRHAGLPQVKRAGPAVRRAREALDSDPSAAWNLGTLSAMTRVSRFALVRSFARETGMTPHAYLVQRRVRLARSLIAAGETLVEAALRSGFADQSHMTRAFVRQYGYTPGAFATLG